MKITRKGDSGAAVRQLCVELSRNGYAVAESDFFNDAVHHVLLNFQADRGLVADGIAGYNTWEALLFGNLKRSDTLTEEDYGRMAQLLDCEAPALKAVCRVETGGRGGFIAPSRPVILFEGHIFWRQLKRKGIDPRKFLQDNGDILHPEWNKKHYIGGAGEYERLERARLIDRESADESASWGMFQLLGCNYALCGEKNISEFVAAMSDSERKQLILAGRFMRNAGILPALQRKDWAEFARRYNGNGYRRNAYDTKLKNCYDSLI